VADHLATQYAPMTLLQYVADRTSHMRLATLVLDNDFRNPAVLAKESASLDRLSGGRLELGLGAGWLLDEYRQAGLAFQDGPTRAARLEEAVHLLKALFSEAPASFSGRFYTVHEVDGRPKPHQRPHPTLMIGGTQPRVLRFAAREADIVGFHSGPPIRACGALTRCVARPTSCMRRWARCCRGSDRQATGRHHSIRPDGRVRRSRRALGWPMTIARRCARCRESPVRQKSCEKSCAEVYVETMRISGPSRFDPRLRVGQPESDYGIAVYDVARSAFSRSMKLAAPWCGVAELYALPDGRLAALCPTAHQVRLIDPKTGQQVGSVSVSGEKGGTSPDGSKLWVVSRYGHPQEVDLVRGVIARTGSLRRGSRDPSVD
jgi:hypothetical protein